MNLTLPQTYLLGLVGLLTIVAILVGRQLLKVRGDEMKLVNLEQSGASSSKEAAELYELAAVQLRKRLYPQAIKNLKQAIKYLSEEPDEAWALVENALGFALAAEEDYEAASKHYRSALKAKAEYPVALNNLALAQEKLMQQEQAAELYRKVLTIEPRNNTARKRLKRLEKLMPKAEADSSPESADDRGF